MLITKALLVLLIAISLALPAASLTIDNFEEGNFNVTDQNTTFGDTLTEVSGLQGANVIGGVRLVRAFVAGVSAGAATAALVTTPAPDDSAVLTYLGSGGTGQFSFIYDGNANLTDDGSAGALGLDLSAFSDLQIDASNVQPGVLVAVQLSSSAQQQTSSQVVLANGATLIPLSIFTIDLSDIQTIRVNLSGLDPAGDSTLISNISAVPEPGTALLLAIGLTGLAIRSRR